MQLIIKEKNKVRLNKLVDWIMHIAGHTIAFVLVTNLFDSVYIDERYPIFFSILIVFLVAILNKTIKPLLVRRTIPITGLTFGLFYPCINLFILKLVDWILGNHFQLNNIFMALFFAILLSIVNFIIEEIIKKIIKRVKKYE